MTDITALHSGTIESMINGREELPHGHSVLEIVLITKQSIGVNEKTILLLTDGEDYIAGVLAPECTILPTATQIPGLHTRVRLTSFGKIEALTICITSLEIISEGAPIQQDTKDTTEEEQTPRKRLRTSADTAVAEDYSLTCIDKDILSEYSTVETDVNTVHDAANNILISIKSRLVQLNHVEREWIEEDIQAKQISDLAPNIIKLDIRGRVFKVRKDLLLSVKFSYFYALLSTNIFTPDKDGAYFLDMSSDGLEEVLVFLETGDITFKGANHYIRKQAKEWLKFLCLKETDDDIESKYLATQSVYTTANNDFMINLTSSSSTTGHHAKKCLDIIEKRFALLARRKTNWESFMERLEKDSIKASSVVALDFRGHVFKTSRKTLLKNTSSYFYAMLSSGTWLPDQNGAYFIDRWSHGFDRLIDYMKTGELLLTWLTEAETECAKANIEYFQLNQSSDSSTNDNTDENEKLCSLIQLRDGRLCSSSISGVIKIWDQYTHSCLMTLVGHKERAWVIQLKDGRLCSCSYDATIRLWSLELTTSTAIISIGTECKVSDIAQLSDGRVCAIWRSKANVVLAHQLNIWKPQKLSWDRFLTASGNITCMACMDSSVRKLIVAGTCTKIILVYNIGRRRPTRSQFTGHTSGPIVNVLQVNKSCVCSAALGDSLLRIWNVTTREIQRAYETNGISRLFGSNQSINPIIIGYNSTENQLILFNLINVANTPNRVIDCGVSTVEIATLLSSGSICTADPKGILKTWEVK